MTSKSWAYTGRELESMAVAVNYHRWILDLFRPFLGKRLVEVGAGAGSFSEMILETRPESLDSLEPSANMYPLLEARLRSADKDRVGHTYQRRLSDAVEAIRAAGIPDSVIYVNVLEHIEDDRRELTTIHALLKPGGHVFIFVPAVPWLMGTMDRQLGHFRRYTMSDLVTKCKDAGFTIKSSRYFDMPGMVPWWLKYCLLRSQTMEPGAVLAYDRFAIPVIRFLESIFTPPIGKNIVLIAQKPV